MHVPGSRLGEYTGHFTDSVCGFNKIKEKKKRGDSTESYRRVFNTFLLHFDTHIYRFFSHDKAHILKFRTLAFFSQR